MAPRCAVNCLGGDSTELTGNCQLHTGFPWLHKHAEAQPDTITSIQNKIIYFQYSNAFEFFLCTSRSLQLLVKVADSKPSWEILLHGHGQMQRESQNMPSKLRGVSVFF